MQIVKEIPCAAAAARVGGAIPVMALIAVCLLFQSPSSAAGVAGAAGAARAADSRARTNAQVNSKSPYAAWRAKREQAEKPDTSGHGHRAPHPQGQSRPRRVPQ